MISKATLNQFILFAGIGVLGTAGHYLVLILLVELKLLAAVPASIFGFIVGAIINYVLNYHVTFKSNKSHKEAFTKFFIVALVGAVINTILMYLGVEVLLLHYIMAQLIATGIVLIWNFVINKFWTFTVKK